MPGHMRLTIALLLALAVAACAPAPPAPVEPATIVMQDLGFGAPDRPLRAGDTVRWVNKDIFDHTATARNGAWRVVVPAGATATLVLNTAGTFEYYCEYHPTMTATLTVAAAD